MKYLKLISIFIITFTCVMQSYAADELFAVEKDPVWSPNGAFRFVTKDGQAAAVGTIVFKMVFPAAHSFDPPTTNVPAGGLVT